MHLGFKEADESQAGVGIFYLEGWYGVQLAKLGVEGYGRPRLEYRVDGLMGVLCASTKAPVCCICDLNEALWEKSSLRRGNVWASHTELCSIFVEALGRWIEFTRVWR